MTLFIFICCIFIRSIRKCIQYGDSVYASGTFGSEVNEFVDC